MGLFDMFGGADEPVTTESPAAIDARRQAFEAQQAMPRFRQERDSLFGNITEKLNPFELISLPHHAIGETVGALRAGEGLFGSIGAGLEGLYRGTDEAQYPSIGEQFVPKEFDEGLGRKVGRLGVDIAGDPLTYVGGPVFRAAGKALGPVARRVGDIPGMQRLRSRLWTSVEDIAKRYGGAGGRVAADKTRNMIQSAETQIGKYIADYDDTLRSLGLHGSSKAQVAAREAAMDALEDPNVIKRIDGVYELVGSSGSSAVDELALGTARMLAVLGLQAEGFTDLFGEGLKVFDLTTNKSSPFKRLENYFPAILRETITKNMNLGTDAGVQAAINRLMKKHNIPRLTAERLVKRMKAPMRAGNIELARTRDLSKAILERDPAKVLPRYLAQIFNRMSFGKEFGLKGKHLDELLSRARDAGLEKDLALEMADLIKGTPRFSKSGIDALSRKISGYQVLNKMGPLSTISNMSQNINTAISEGVGGFTSGVARSIKDPNSRVGAIAFNRSLRDAMEQILGATREGWASKWLSLSLFNQTEAKNRLIAANAGIATMERLLGSSRTATVAKDLAKRGFSRTLGRAYQSLGRLPTKGDDLQRLTSIWGREISENAARRGATHVNPQQEAFELASKAIDDLYKVGLRASEKTQHATKFLDLPAGWQSPEMRLMTQFKSFLKQQTNFLMREIAKPAMAGNYGPMLRAAAAFGIGGPIVAEARDKYRQGMGWLLTGDAPKPRHEFDWDHPILSAIKDSVYVGGLGLAGDVAQSAAQGRLGDFLMGPTVSQGVDWTQALAMRLAERKGLEGMDIVEGAFELAPGRRGVGLFGSEIRDVDMGGVRGLFGG